MCLSRHWNVVWERLWKIHVKPSKLCVSTTNKHTHSVTLNMVRLLTWASFTLFQKRTPVGTTVYSVADKLLMPLRHCFGYVLKALHSMSKILEVVVFAFKLHTPKSYKGTVPVGTCTHVQLAQPDYAHPTHFNYSLAYYIWVMDHVMHLWSHTE